MDIMPIPPMRKWYKEPRVLTLVVFAAIFLGVFGFLTFRTWYFYDQIQERGIEAVALDFSTRFTRGAESAVQAQAVPPKELKSSDDPSFGNPNSKLTIVEFADFECPYSREEASTFRELALKYKDQARFIYRDFPLDTIHKNARLAAEASECADEQDKFWQYHDKLYSSESLEKETLMNLAVQAGLDETRFKKCLEASTYRGEVQADYELGSRAGIRGTPTFFVNGVKIEGAIPKPIFERIIQEALSSDT